MSNKVNIVSDMRPQHLRRIEAVDVVRGLIIVLMALDHVRDFFGDQSAQPTNLATTTVALFFTRWVTHICAPTFFLLTGVSARLTLGRMSRPALSRFLLSRGAWLLFLELVVMRFALQFNVDYHVTIITVLWGLGWAMIVLAGLTWLPSWLIAGFGAILVVGHNTLDGIEVSSLGVWRPVWAFLHSPGILFSNAHSVVVVSYVLIPWVGVTALGYVLGQLYQDNGARRQSLLWGIGLSMTVGFIVLRWLNIYGDPVPWMTQRSALWTTIAFLNTNKYPPSLLFLLMTLGPTLLLLGAFENTEPRLLRPALIIGKVPLFFYVLHFYLIHLLATAASYLRFGEVANTFRSPDLAHFPFTQPPGWGAPLGVIYLLWIAVLVLMYPLCDWFAKLKGRRRDWWLSYL
ncbi:MAG TPA: heparan-alpha-glucosaminide N-acetyltransferase domain-containing protein [Steroidobacteraceae bacterium]